MLFLVNIKIIMMAQNFTETHEKSLSIFLQMLLHRIFKP